MAAKLLFILFQLAARRAELETSTQVIAVEVEKRTAELRARKNVFRRRAHSSR